ncbi:MAG TPA: hypothetical protein VI877_00495, partial [Dehalococcoidia bacterium]|nr:hypothetical protein [Dehalococcoidia bacterium]
MSQQFGGDGVERYYGSASMYTLEGRAMVRGEVGIWVRAGDNPPRWGGYINPTQSTKDEKGDILDHFVRGEGEYRVRLNDGREGTATIDFGAGMILLQGKGA